MKSKKKLEDFRSYNNRKFKEYWEVQGLEGKDKTGIACPDCGEEMLVNRSIIYTSLPPKHKVDCPKCKYWGFIIC